MAPVSEKHPQGWGWLLEADGVPGPSLVEMRLTWWYGDLSPGRMRARRERAAGSFP